MGEVPVKCALARSRASRDERDANRAVSPLRPAEDAVVIDTTTLTIEQVLEKVLSEIRIKYPEAITRA